MGCVGVSWCVGVRMVSWCVGVRMVSWCVWCADGVVVCVVCVVLKLVRYVWVMS
jgi:hypothetical protein